MKITKRQLEAEARRVFGSGAYIEKRFVPVGVSYEAHVADFVALSADAYLERDARRRLYDVLRGLERREG